MRHEVKAELVSFLKDLADSLVGAKEEDTVEKLRTWASDLDQEVKAARLIEQTK